MGRRKATTESALRYEVKTRITEADFNRLKNLLDNSRHRKMAGLVRQILCDRPIATYSVDQTLGVTVEELARIRRVLSGIGNNVNQVVRQFHSSGNRGDKLSLVFDIAELQSQVIEQTEKLFPMISDLSKLWLRK